MVEKWPLCRAQDGPSFRERWRRDDNAFGGENAFGDAIPWGVFEIPTVNGSPALDTQSNLAMEMLVEDCGGHGRTLDIVYEEFL